MPKYNAYIRRAAGSRPVKKLEITDFHTGDVFTTFVRRADVPDINRINDLTTQAARKYVPKELRVDCPWLQGHDEPLPFPPIDYDGELIVTETACKSAAHAVVAQSLVDDQGNPVPSENFLTLEDFLAMSFTSQTTWAQLMGAINELGIDRDPGNDSAGTPTSSGQPSPTTL